MNNSTHGRLAVVGVVMLLLVTLPQAQVGPVSEQSATQGLSSRSGWWLVELSTPPTAEGGSLCAVRAEQAAFRRSAGAAGIRFEERFAFETVFNGLSIRSSRAHASPH